MRTKESLCSLLALLIIAAAFVALELLPVTPAYNPRLNWPLRLTCLAVVFTCGTVLWLAERRARRSLDRIAAALYRFNHLRDAKLDLSTSPSAAVARIIEDGVDSLVHELESLRSEHDKLHSIFSGMRQGLIAVDSRLRLMEVNAAAFELLGCEGVKFSKREGEGPAIGQVFRHAGLQRFVQSVLSSPDGIEEVLTVDHADGERFMQTYGHTLRNRQGEPLGLLVTFYDVTQLQHLEKVRREFIANVSHELKTPVTSIKGFVETLTDGAIENPEDARRFLGIIARQADRLNAIFEDLLNLSRIELEKERGAIKLEWGQLEDVVSSVLQTWELPAAERQIDLQGECPEDLKLKMNPSLLEQALGNLVENAIKYSDRGAKIRIAVQRSADEVQLSVSDTGRGIDKVHLDRIFERFYRIDRARSRKEGGTGLGLAIVKHIAQAHGGYPSVESKLGQGSCFRIHVPVEEESVGSGPSATILVRSNWQRRS